MKTTSRGKKPFLLSVISFIAVMLMIVGCGGGGGTGPVVPDTQQPIIHEMKYEGEAGTDITSDSRAAAQGTLYVKASDNQTQSNQLTFDIKNGNGSFTSYTVTKGNDGYYVKEVAMRPQNIYERGNFDGFDATARVRDATGNGTLEKRFFELGLSNIVAVAAIEDGFTEKNPEGLFGKFTFKINGVDFEFEKGGQWRNKISGQPRGIFLRYDAVSENNPEMPASKKIHDSNGLKIYESDNIQAIVGEIDSNLSESQIKDLAKTAVDVMLDYFGFGGLIFYMGNTRDDPEGDTDEKPVHGVILTYSYYIATHELTFNEYDAYCDDKGIPKPSDQGWGRGTRPVINVSWWDAIKYCNWLSIENGFAPAYNETTGALLDKSGNVTTDITTVEGYRLPTEAEWEYAARGGIADITNGNEANDYKYAGSNTLNEVGWFSDNSGYKTQPVGQKKANELGLYDMSGNVWEWCHDWWGGYASTTQTNPTGPSSGSDRVERGGSWDDGARDCRVTDRDDDAPTSSDVNLGFRLSRTSF